jgi:hypothetical protein
MGGHGQAFEYLLIALQEHDLNSVSASTVMKKVKQILQNSYMNWNPFPSQDELQGLLVSIIGRTKLKLNEVIPGTTVTVDQVLQAGLFRYDEKEEILTVAYIWTLLMRDLNGLPELMPINFDYDYVRQKLGSGSSYLSSAAFEEF